MIKLIIVREYEYIPIAERDLPKEQQTVFKLKTLSSEQQLIIEDNSYEYDGDTNKTKLRLSTSIEKRIELGIIGWNLKDDTGKDIPFNSENRIKLPIATKKELSKELIASSRMSEAEEKN